VPKQAINFIAPSLDEQLQTKSAAEIEEIGVGLFDAQSIEDLWREL
jgi:hypothetical protein